jgi:hypothetical protein
LVAGWSTLGNMSNQWDDFLGQAESTGYVTGDVAQTWNAHAAQSDAALDAADDALASNNAALYDAAANLGTDPEAVQDAFGRAEASLQDTYEAQLASMGIESDPLAGADG